MPTTQQIPNSINNLAERDTRPHRHRLTARGVFYALVLFVGANVILSIWGPFRGALDWMGDVGQRVEQTFFPDEEFLTTVQRTFATNFTESVPIGASSTDINVNDLESGRQGDLFGLGESSQSIDTAIATVHWTVFAHDVRINREDGEVTVHLPEAVFTGISVPLDGLAFAEYEANFVARVFDVFNGVDSTEPIRAEFVRQLNEQADLHAPRLKAMAEAAAERSVLGLFAGQETTVVVVFDR